MITREVVNKIGIEAEVLIRDKNDKLIYPDNYYMAKDDFIILGEIRGKPYSIVSDVVFEFYKDFYAYKKVADYNKLSLDLSGYTILTPEFYAEILRKMGSKEIAKCENIYKTDILNLSDDVLEDGKITGHKVSTGLHIHFSSDIVVTETNELEPFIPYKDGLYLKSNVETREEKETKIYSLLTNTAIKSIVRALDRDIYPKYKINADLKFRQPGFFERKAWGFEYRSLPFTGYVFDNLTEIVEYCFDLLRKLEKVLK